MGKINTQSELMEKAMRLANPSRHFTLFSFNVNKYAQWRYQVLSNPLHLSDHSRTPENTDKLLMHILTGENFSIPYEINNDAGDFCGILSFLNIVPDFKCAVSFQIWDKSPWSKSAVRETRALFEYIMGEFNLKKAESQTADPVIVHLAKIIGFKVEGQAKNSFMCNGELRDVYILGMMGTTGKKEN